jgi:beta-galactosidase/beta-glucuronidase
MLHPSQLDALQLGYPRPQMARHWESLNGQWQFAIDFSASFTSPEEVTFDAAIVVPFAPETERSGINNNGHYKAAWYKLSRATPPLQAHERLMLHFGAVDHQATVWVNGQYAGAHEGGYTPFSIDITDFLKSGATKQTIVVRAEDNPHDLEKNRGKQDWEEKSHGIWYPRTTGIWQTVWWEVVPSVHITCLDWTPCLDDWSMAVTATVSGTISQGTMLEVLLTRELPSGTVMLAHQLCAFTAADAELQTIERKLELRDIKRRMQLPDEPMRELRQWLLWSNAHPNLINAVVRLRRADGSIVDEVSSYTALRKVERRGRKIFINGVEEKLRLVLDQGYWPESGMTAPSDEAMKKDVELARRVFNGVRKHNKLEDPRFHYWADKIGLYVWQELPSAYLFTRKSMKRSLATWTEAVERDRNHPCIIAWVPINESWGVPNLPQSEAERQFQAAMYFATKSMTDGGITVGNDGWEMVISDLLAIHDYDANPENLKARYANGSKNIKRLFEQERPGGRALVLGDMLKYDDRPILLTEFGGIKLSKDKGSWGYSEVGTAEELCSAFEDLMEVVRNLELLAGFCYTEFTDCYQEANGLFTMDRKPKFSQEEMHKAVWGY